MAIAIRLSRGGAKKRPYYKVVVADSRRARDGKYLEQIGTYNPLLPKDDEKRVKIDEDRARHWLGLGAQPSDRVARFLDAAGIRERAVRNNPNKAVPGEKANERAEERAAKVAEAEEAAKVADEAPAEEAPAKAVTEEGPAEEAATEAVSEEATAEAVSEDAPAADEVVEEVAVAEAVETAPEASGETTGQVPEETTDKNVPEGGASSQEPAEGGDEVVDEAIEDKAEG